jgi:hypothetical protein
MAFQGERGPLRIIIIIIIIIKCPDIVVGTPGRIKQVSLQGMGFASNSIFCAKQLCAMQNKSKKTKKINVCNGSVCSCSTENKLSLLAELLICPAAVVCRRCLLLLSTAGDREEHEPQAAQVLRH